MHGVQAPGLVEMATGTNLADYACDIYVGKCRKFKKLYKPPPAERFLYPPEAVLPARPVLPIYRLLQGVAEGADPSVGLAIMHRSAHSQGCWRFPAPEHRSAHIAWYHSHGARVPKAARGGHEEGSCSRNGFD